MTYIPYGYKIENGMVVVDEEKAAMVYELIGCLFGGELAELRNDRLYLATMWFII